MRNNNKEARTIDQRVGRNWQIIFGNMMAILFASTSIRGQIDTERSGCKQIAF